MKKFAGAIIAAAVFCFALAIAPAPAAAASHHKHHHTAHAKNTVKDRAHIRTAQVYLDQLGYNPGTADGVMGRKTRAALKAFQKDHHQRATGILDAQSFKLLAREAGSREPQVSSAGPQHDFFNERPNFFTRHPDFYGYYGANYTNPTMLGSPQAIPSRFGDLQMTAQQDSKGGQDYAVTLNGQTVFHADNQPAVINASRTFNLDGADAILFTSYTGNDSACPYRHQLLIVRANSNGLHDITNCTRSYEAYTENGSLFISFPQDRANDWSAGALWRYENGIVQKL